MKKLIAILLFTGAPASAAFLPLALSTGGVNASTVAVVNAGGVALKVDGSAVTQPASQIGTWTVQPGNTQNTTAWIVQTSSFGTNGSTIAVTNAGGTKLLVTPDSVALPANQSVNVAQLAGVTTSLNTGVRDAGTLRVTVATNDIVPASQSGTWTVQPGNTANTTGWVVQISSWGTNGSTIAVTNASGTKLLVTPDSVALPANQSVNVAQMAGVTTSMNTGVRDTGTQRVTIATNDVVPASQSGTWTVQPGNTANTTAWIVQTSSFGTNGSTIAVVNAGGTKLAVTPDSVALPANQSVNVNQIGGTNVLTGGTNGSLGIGGLAASGAAASGNPVESGLRVTSTTIPTAASDGQTIYQASSNIGQALVTGMPGGLVLYTTATLTTNTAETVLISSAGAATYNYLCGCIVTNTSATNASIKLRRAGSTTPVEAGNILIGAPANFVPAGIWPGCTDPFMRSLANSNITVTGSASVTSLEVRCQYYQGP